MGSLLNQEQEMLVHEEDIKKLVSIFANSASDSTSYPEKLRDFTEIQQKSALLLAKDYVVRVINDNGSISSICSEKIVSLVLPSCGTGDETVESEAHGQRTEELSGHPENVPWTRARTRLAVPVMFYGDKHICRLVTLPDRLETDWQAITDFFGAPGDYCAQVCRSMVADIWEEDKQAPNVLVSEEKSFWAAEEGGPARDPEATPKNDGQAPTETFRDALLYGELRREDILLLKELSVLAIVDLTAQEKGRYVPPSQKANRWSTYDDLYIFKLPYPGWDFFKKFKKHYYSEEGMVYGWGENIQDFALQLHNYDFWYLGIEWNHYDAWDLVRLTKNYLRYLLKLVLGSTASLLVHCIYGWDRSPLFISLLRLSLWADGAIHKGLSPVEMAYLTIAYDWFLFCHDLPDRVEKSEENFLFCLHMLKLIHTEEFSILSLASKIEKPGSIHEVSAAEAVGGNVEDLQFNMSPGGRSSSSLSSFGPDGPPKYFSVPSSPDEERARKWSPPQHSPRSAHFMSPKKSTVADAIIASALAVSATPDVAVGHHTDEASAAPKSPLSLLPAERPPSCGPSASDGSGTAEETLSRAEFLHRRRERLAEVRRLVSDAYRCILEETMSTTNRASYWAGSLYSETSEFLPK